MYGNCSISGINQGKFKDGWMDGWMACKLKSFSTVFHPNQDDGQMIMKAV